MTTPTPHPTPETLEQRARREWQDLLEKDDRTSSEEYPDMCLITYEEFTTALLAFYREGGDQRAQALADEFRARQQIESALRRKPNVGNGMEFHVGRSSAFNAAAQFALDSITPPSPGVDGEER